MLAHRPDDARGRGDEIVGLVAVLFGKHRELSLGRFRVGGFIKRHPRIFPDNRLDFFLEKIPAPGCVYDIDAPGGVASEAHQDRANRCDADASREEDKGRSSVLYLEPAEWAVHLDGRALLEVEKAALERAHRLAGARSD